MVLKYSHITVITFSSLIHAHSFSMRCSPFQNSNQRIIEENVSAIPHCSIARNTDSMGSTVDYGYIEDYHDSFAFESRGIISVSSHISKESNNPLFFYATPLTSPSSDLIYLAHLLDARAGEEVFIRQASDLIHKHVQYVSGSTDVCTSAEAAFAQGKGVCQDFAHIAICLCRLCGISARYVNGYMLGEGQTHAWVEYFIPSISEWHAYDPTNNRVVDDSYIKLAQGRDYNDCRTNHGVFRGDVSQTMHVRLSVQEVLNGNYLYSNVI